MRKFLLVPSILIFVFILVVENVFGQGVGISEASITPDASSILELRSTARGFLVPRMTTGERDGIGAPVTGLLIYNTTLSAFQFYNGGWSSLNSGAVTTVTASAPLASSGGTAPDISVSGTIAIANGGTNSSTALTNNQIMISSAGAIAEAGATTNGQLLIGSTGLAPVIANLTGTANQISVTNGAGSITLAAPQDIHTAASPTFAGLTLSGLTTNSFLFSGTGSLLTATAAPTNGQLLIGSTGVAPVAATLTGTANQIDVTNGAGSITLSTPTTIKLKSTDESTLSDITLTDDAVLTFAVAANTKYAFTFHIWYDTPTAADFKYAVANSGATITLVRIRKKSVAPGATAFVITATETTFGTSTSIATNSATPGEIDVSGVVQIGATGGTLSFQWAQNTSTASNTTVVAGSYVEYSK